MGECHGPGLDQGSGAWWGWCLRWGDGGAGKSAEAGEGEQVPRMGNGCREGGAFMRRRGMWLPRLSPVPTAGGEMRRIGVCTRSPGERRGLPALSVVGRASRASVKEGAGGLGSVVGITRHWMNTNVGVCWKRIVNRTIGLLSSRSFVWASHYTYPHRPTANHPKTQAYRLRFSSIHPSIDTRCSVCLYSRAFAMTRRLPWLQARRRLTMKLVRMPSSSSPPRVPDGPSRLPFLLRPQLLTR
jgi:hypothetical protein